MSLPKIVLFLVLVLFGTIGVVAWLKHEKRNEQATVISNSGQLEATLEVKLEEPLKVSSQPKPVEVVKREVTSATLPPVQVQAALGSSGYPLPDLSPEVSVDRVNEFFNLIPPKFPIVETITYRSRVSWLEGRPAWLADYATHYGTSRHFIARSLNQKPDYYSQKIVDGNRFNVLRSDIPLSFHLVLDLSRCHMRFYYVSGDEKVLIKTYEVGVGRPDPNSASGLLTPIGTYSLGKKVAIYQPGSMGFFNNQPTELVRIFGTRWIPFENEIGDCTAPAKGFGIHGAPWTQSTSNEWSENSHSILRYESDGCIRLATKDVEELFAIIITKPTTIEIVRDFKDASNVPLIPKN